MNDSCRSITLCPACGAAAWGSANFCPACGKSLRGAGRISLPEEDETSALCGVCGAQVPLSAGFCPNCGAARRYPFRHASAPPGEDAPDAGTGTRRFPGDDSRWEERHEILRFADARRSQSQDRGTYPVFYIKLHAFSEFL